MKRTLLLCALVLAGTAGPVSAQITVTLNGAGTVASANDFATTVLQDPWDMNERTDLGWWLNSVDQPYPGFRQRRTSPMASSRARSPPIPMSGCSNRALRTCPPIGKNGNNATRSTPTYIGSSPSGCGSRPARASDYLLFHWWTRTHLRSARVDDLGPGLRPPPGGASTSLTWRRSDCSPAARLERHQAIAPARSRSRQRDRRQRRSTSTGSAWSTTSRACSATVVLERRRRQRRYLSRQRQHADQRSESDARPRWRRTSPAAATR